MDWTWLLVILTFLVGIFYYFTRNFNYWKDRGIPGAKPIIFMGTAYEFLFAPSASEMMLNHWKKYGNIYGGFIGSRPLLSICDPQLVRDIMIKDFHKFVDRNDFEFGDVLNDRSLFNLKGEDWKGMRSIISPTFSSGKMKKMHPIIAKCVDRLEEVIAKRVKDGNNEINIKQYMGKLTMDVIATCAFATKIDVYDEKKTNDFIFFAQKVFRGNMVRVLTFLSMIAIFPKFAKKTGFKITDPGVVKFFTSAVQSIVSQRKANSKHNDYLQLMINAKNKSADHDEHENLEDMNEEIFGKTDGIDLQKNRSNIRVTDDDILANTFLFLVAGYETTASLLSHLIYSLALDEECQQRLYEEVKQFDGKYDYENIAKMPYLEACIAETLRLYNPLPNIGRMAAEDYVLGNTGLTIPKGMIISANVQALHRNPEYYPSPDRFDPERFMPENKDKLVPYTYMPFGMGPRNCVGMRFALMEAKTAAANLIYRFKFSRTANTRVPLKAAKRDFILNTGDIFVGIEPRIE